MKSEQYTKIRNEIERRFPNGPKGQIYWYDLLVEYGESGLAPPHFLSELLSPDQHKFWTNVWEAMLYRHLKGQGFDVRGCVRKSGQIGPDFCIEHDGQKIWIDAVVPKPEGLPKEWIGLPEAGIIRAHSMPHEGMLLRWTSVLKSKRDKLERDCDTGIIAPNDCIVVAVNCCQLRNIATDDLGISQLPFAVEAAFPLGPLAVTLTSDGEMVSEPAHTIRFKVQNRNGVDVPTGCFLDPRYARISAIVSAYQSHTINRGLALTVVHNPLATVPGRGRSFWCDSRVRC